MKKEDCLTPRRLKALGFIQRKSEPSLWFLMSNNNNYMLEYSSILNEIELTVYDIYKVSLSPKHEHLKEFIKINEDCFD